MAARAAAGHAQARGIDAVLLRVVADVADGMCDVFGDLRNVGFRLGDMVDGKHGVTPTQNSREHPWPD